MRNRIALSGLLGAALLIAAGCPAKPTETPAPAGGTDAAKTEEPAEPETAVAGTETAGTDTAGTDSAAVQLSSNIVPAETPMGTDAEQATELKRTLAGAQSNITRWYLFWNDRQSQLIWDEPTATLRIRLQGQPLVTHPDVTRETIDAVATGSRPWADPTAAAPATETTPAPATPEPEGANG